MSPPSICEQRHDEYIMAMYGIVRRSTTQIIDCYDYLFILGPQANLQLPKLPPMFFNTTYIRTISMDHTEDGERGLVKQVMRMSGIQHRFDRIVTHGVTWC